MSERYRRWIRQLIRVQALNGPGPLNLELEVVTEMTIVLYRQLTQERRIPRVLLFRLNRTINSFSPTEIPDSFRFRSRHQLRQLLELLKIPQRIRLPHRHSCTGEELLLIGLYRLSSTKDLVDLENTFGRDYTWISRVFDMFVLWMEREHKWRLFDNLDFWVNRIPRYAESIRLKVNEVSGVELFAPGNFSIFSFMDCTNQPIAR